MKIPTERIRECWTPISHLFSVTNEDEYDRAVELLSSLIDEIGADERHPLYGFLDALGGVIDAYEEKNYPMPECDGIGIRRFFMDEHGLAPSDLPEIGSKNTVSEIISGQRGLSVRHIRALAERFHVPPAVFV